MKKKERFLTVNVPGCHPVEIGTYSLIMRKPTEESMMTVPPKAQFGPTKTVSPAVCFETTSGCNLRCSYCFKGEEKPSEVLSATTAISFLKKYMPSSKFPGIKIVFMGGEPTMNMALIVRVYDYCRKQYKKTNYSMTSNGTRLGLPLKDTVGGMELSAAAAKMKVGEFLNAIGCATGVSIDGPEEVHDVSRLCADGTGSLGVILDNLQLCKNSGWRISGARATLGEGLNELSLRDRLEWFWSLFSDGLVRSVHFEASPESFNSYKNYSDMIMNQHLDAAKWYCEKANEEGAVMPWVEVAAVMRRLVKRTPQYNTCASGVNYLICSPVGDLFACHRTKNSMIGNIKDGLSCEMAHMWSDPSVMCLDPCSDCSLRFACTGVCRAENLAATGDISVVSKESCAIHKARIMSAIYILQHVPWKLLGFGKYEQNNPFFE